MPKTIFHSQPTIDNACAKAVECVVRSGYVSQGPKVRQFERAVAEFHGVKDATAVSSGTAALHCALLALNVKKEDEVIIPTYVCTALLNAVQYIGAKPVLTDVEDDGNISFADTRKKLTQKTKAVIIPHMFGKPADLKSFKKLGVPIIEDCAQSFGARLNNKKAGTTGALGIFSFYATKVITTGNGGMVIGNNVSLIKKIRNLREYDHKKDYRLRYNYMMSDMQAALGIEQLKRLPGWIKRRCSIARAYNAAFAQDFSSVPVGVKGQEHIYYRYVVQYRGSRDAFIKKMQRRGIICAEPVFKPIHRYLGRGTFPNAEKLMRRNISIPIYPSLTTEDIKRIINSVHASI